MPSHTPSEEAQVSANKDAHYGVIADRIGAIASLEGLLAETDKAKVLSGLKKVRIGGKPLGFDERFTAEDLPRIQDAMREVIAQLEEENEKVGGLSSAIREKLVGVVKTAPERESTYETQLEGPQVEWVRKGIEARYERSRLVSGPLRETDGVPAFPSMEAVLKSALKRLTREQVAYMMEEGRPAFSFQMKLVTPSKQLELQKALVNGQPKKMDTPNQKQQDLDISNSVEAHLASRPSPEKMEWKWEFLQADQLIEEPQKGDDASLRLEDRVKSMKYSRPEGMRGMDRYSWAALAADLLEQGTPLDVRFKGDAKDTEDCEKWLFTVLDEEGEWIGAGSHNLVGGSFGSDSRKAYLYKYNADRPRDHARFRSSVDGSIDA